jgi:serine/threonine protein kinase
MSEPIARADSWFQQSWSRLEQVVEQFEAAWQRGQAPSIEAYLPAGQAEAGRLLVELAHADLELRLKAGEAARVETYFERFADLTTDRRAALGLIAREFDLRRRREPGLRVDEYLDRFPQYRADLAERLPGPHARPATPSVPSSQCLGKFELLETVGQGAFGTVYRARDLELDRIVAVKVPRGDRSATPADEERFVREARNAAQLSHPGIVPVYEVRRDAAVPYIVSAFIRGVTLADTSAAHRLDFRQTADVIAQVAEALDHAHQQGVVHRDLKPSNIMLGNIEGAKDRSRDSGVRNQESGVKSQESGVSSQESATVNRESTVVDGRSPPLRAFVMDFGLARRDEGDVRLTVEGQILGTPAYMSPEQARGEIFRIDGRSDLYSLGVILYELLTGELPFRGVTRMMLKQIVEEEPRPPRRLNDKIPRDLETIALKCMAKEPGRRYETAGALAEDLRRHLDGRPILARPIGRVARTWRWVKRNPRVAVPSIASVVLLSFLAIAGTATAFVISAQKRAETQARQQAENSAESARRNRDAALDAFDALIFEVQEQMWDQPALDQLRKCLLDRAVAKLRSVADLAEADADPRLGAAHARLGDIFIQLERWPEAQQHYEQCQAIARDSLTSDPPRERYEYALCISTAKLGEIRLQLNDLPAAERLCNDALGLAEAMWQSNSENVFAAWALRDCHDGRGAVQLRKGELRRAMESYARAVEFGKIVVAANRDDPVSKKSLAREYEFLGDMRVSAGMIAPAREAHEAAIQLRREVAEALPSSARAKRELSLSYDRLGDVHLRLQDGTAAAQLYRKALELRQQLAAPPRNPQAQRDLALSHGKLGEAAENLNDWREARAQFEMVFELTNKLLEVDPNDAQARRDRAAAHLRLGRLGSRQGDMRYAREQFLMGLEDFEKVAADPDNVPAQVELAAILGHCGNAEKDSRNFARAAEHYQRGVAILAKLESQGKLADQPVLQGWLRDQQGTLAFCQEVLRALDDLGYARTQPPKLAVALLTRRGLVLADRSRHSEAAETAASLHEFAPDNPIALYNVACIYARCVPLVAPANSAEGLSAAERALRDRYAANAIAALKESVERGFKDLKLLESDADLAAIRATDEYRQVVQRLKAGVGKAAP